MSLRACALLLVALASVACGGNPGMRAQGARYSDVPDADESNYAQRKPVAVLEGKASYYHDSLAGNHTANGERYDPERLTAASRDLPFGSVVRVIRKDTGASVLVRINDRGPFGQRQRILDLSRAAARELAMLRRGVADIRAEVLWLAPPKQRRKRQR